MSCANKKKIAYKNDPRNKAGEYFLETALPDGSTVLQGETIVIAIPYKNTTNKAIGSATITDTLDPKYTYLDSDPAKKCVMTGDRITCTVPGLAPGKSDQVVFRVKVKSSAAVGVVNNTATIKTNDGSEARCYNNLKVEVQPKADVECLTKTAMVDATTNPAPITEVTKGQEFTYVISLENKGNAPAGGYEIVDVLAGEGRAELGFVSSSDCTFNTTSRTVKCPVALNAGQKKSYAFRVIVRQSTADGTTIKNVGSVFASTGAGASPVSTCINNLTVKNPLISAVKKAYKDSSANTPGNYALSEEISTVSRNQTFVYSVKVTNTGSGKAVGVVFTDSLTGQGQENLSYVDSDDICSWTADTKTISCTFDLEKGASKDLSFRVRVNDTIENGTVIKNVGLVKLGTQVVEVKKDLNVSSVVDCNQTCSTNSECGEGLTCSTTAGKCRNNSCSTETSCVCPVTTTPTPTATATPTSTTTPTSIVTAAPTVTAEPTVAVGTPTPTAVAQVTPEALPETGIFDTPGIAAFGGGLLLAIIGILLAL